MTVFSLKSMVLRVFDTAWDFVFPKVCFSCGALFILEKKDKDYLSCGEIIHFPAIDDRKRFYRNLQNFVCDKCIKDFCPITCTFCTRCGTPFPGSHDGCFTCGKCLESAPPYSIARSAGIYDLTLKTLVHSYKYRGKTQLAVPLGNWMFQVYMSLFELSGTGGHDLVVPVPLHLKKLRSRGFNQSVLFVRPWVKLLALSGFNNMKLDLGQESLVRVKSTPSQTGLSRKQRSVNLKNAFKIANYDLIRRKRLLLVDDVFTTGSTVKECARVLMSGGAESVDVLTIARRGI